MNLKRWVYVFILITCFQIAYALPAEYEELKISMIDDKIVQTHIIRFSQKVNLSQIDMNISTDVTGFLLTLDNKQITDLESNVSFNELLYEQILDNLHDDEITVKYAPSFDSRRFVVRLVLDKGVSIRSDVSGSILESVFPYPTQVTSDGFSIIILWQYDNVKVGEEKAIFVKINPKNDNTNPNIIFILIVASLFAISLFVYYFIKKRKTKPQKSPLVYKNRPKTIENNENSNNKAEKNDIKDNNILEHLKEDEKTVINILKQKNGECEQGTIRFLGNFSKATLSRILMELEERNIIYKEQKGKKNIIRLK